MLRLQEILRIAQEPEVAAALLYCVAELTARRCKRGSAIGMVLGLFGSIFGLAEPEPMAEMSNEFIRSLDEQMHDAYRSPANDYERWRQQLGQALANQGALNTNDLAQAAQMQNACRLADQDAVRLANGQIVPSGALMNQPTILIPAGRHLETLVAQRLVPSNQDYEDLFPKKPTTRKCAWCAQTLAENTRRCDSCGAPA